MNKDQPNASYYKSINGLRTYAAIGIVSMHVLVNGSYHLNGFVFNKLIPSFTNFVFLFMIISGFSMCCGYYDKITNNQITINQFYTKRYQKIWPFFALLCILDFIVSPSLTTVFEIFANLTLCFSLLPNANISVIGVGWTLGLIFLFYLLFPFFCYLLSSKKKAWAAFLCSIVFNILCTYYFFDTTHVIAKFSARTNFIYCSMFFLAGGLIFLYKDKLKIISSKWIYLCYALCIITIIIYFTLNDSIFIQLLFFSLLIITVIGITKPGIMNNPFTQFISNISMEIYLCHMVIYRIMEKLHMTHPFSSDIISYIITVAGTFLGAMIFSHIINKILFNSIKRRSTYEKT